MKMLSMKFLLPMLSKGNMNWMGKTGNIHVTAGSGHFVTITDYPDPSVTLTLLIFDTLFVKKSFYDIV